MQLLKPFVRFVLQQSAIILLLNLALLLSVKLMLLPLKINYGVTLLLYFAFFLCNQRSKVSLPEKKTTNDTKKTSFAQFNAL